MKKTITFILSVAMLLSLAACGGQPSSSGGTSSTSSGGSSGTSDTNYNFIYAADCAEDTVQGLMIKYFAEQLKEQSGGRMEVQLYFSGSMGSDTECCESAQSGDITFYNSAVSTTSNFFVEATAIDLPYLYPDVKVYRAAMDDTTVMDYYTKRYQENGLHLLGFYDEGMRQLTSNKEVHVAADLSGLKIRVMDSAFHVSIWQALGANPTPMAMSEVYIGLQQGTIDAQENGIETVYANKVYEQQKYMVMTNHLPSSRVLLMNQAMYESLSSADQELVDKVGAQAIAYARQTCDERQDDRKQAMEATGIQFIDLDSAVLDELKGKCASVYDDVRATSGDEVVDMLLSAVEKANP